ncbi:MAG: ubiquinol-cytochrome c reductase iron-sulfur subunit [Candidatus Bathyarchaeia archaeon]
MTNAEESEQIAKRLVTVYGLRVPDDVVASCLTGRPKLPILLSRASFRHDVDVRTQQRSRVQRERRNFLRTMLGLAALSISALTLFEISSFLNQPTSTPSYNSNAGQQVSYFPNSAQTQSAASNSASQGPRLIANASNIPLNQSLALNDPTYGPVILIHLDNGKFVAFSSICTHAGCQVQFDPSMGDIVCPCHGAVYDPNNNAQVIGGPAPYPLQNIPVQYNASTGNIYVTG